MGRLEIIRKFITKDMRGIEIAPWHSPITAKRDGYDCKTLDIFDKQTLVEKNQNGATIPDDKIQYIEEVDFVGNACDIAVLVPDYGAYDYVVSSHNFEHLPNPVKFLQGCSTVLKPSGIVSMAIPDNRGMFDYYRPRSNTGDMIDALTQNRTHPSAKQQFDHHSIGVRHNGNIVFLQGTPKSELTPNQNVGQRFAEWDNRVDYAEVHCSVFTLHSFSLIILELRFLGLIDFEIIDIQSDGGAEFFVHMKKTNIKITQEEFYSRRNTLLQE
jgi:SAM-dependent methyltransferase